MGPQSGSPVGRRLLAWSRQHPKRAAVGVLAVIVVVSIANAGGGKPHSGSGSSASKLPAGATPAVVLAPVVSAIESCAKAATGSPANCPQHSWNGASTVVWTLYGDPGSGAQIAYSGGVFTVAGHTVMTEQDVQSSSATNVHVDHVGYQAAVNWNSGHPSLSALASLDQEPSPAIVVARPEAASDAAVSQALVGAYDQCLSSTKPTLPAGCLGLNALDYAPNSTPSVTWHSGQDVLLNTRVTYDSSYGVFHVIGSYVVDLSWQDPNTGAGSHTYSGNYDAQIAYSGGRLQIMNIAQV